MTINLTVPFSSANYVIVPGSRNSVTADEANYFSIVNSGQFLLLHSNNAAGLADPVSYSFVCFGAQ